MVTNSIIISILIVSILIILVGAIISGILYRCGGVGKPYHTTYRDIGCPIVMLVVMALLGRWHWSLIPSAFLLYGALTTYWKRTPDANWFNWLCTGFGYGLAMLPYSIATGCWLGFSLRVIALSLLTMYWSEKNDNVVWEEVGRGFLIIATLPIL